VKQIFTILQDHPMTLYTVYQYHVSKNATNFLHLIKCTIYLCHLLSNVQYIFVIYYQMYNISLSFINTGYNCIASHLLFIIVKFLNPH
jgi:hypothetical protein